jgi:hypothetical protein
LTFVSRLNLLLLSVLKSYMDVSDPCDLAAIWLATNQF